MADDREDQDPHSYSTQKIPADEIARLKDVVDEESEADEVTLSFGIDADTLARVDELLPRMKRAGGSISFKVAAREIFLAGLDAMEDDLE